VTLEEVRARAEERERRTFEEIKAQLQDHMRRTQEDDALRYDDLAAEARGRGDEQAALAFEAKAARERAKPLPNAA
jgi:hypothetical protein